MEKKSVLWLVKIRVFGQVYRSLPFQVRGGKPEQSRATCE
jgi:hypothetical protein